MKRQPVSPLTPVTLLRPPSEEQPYFFNVEEETMPEAQATQETFVDRLRAELEHLKARIWKLNEFIVGAPAFNTLEHEDRQLLIAQKNAMESYLKILKARLERATSKSSLAAD